MKLLLFSDLHCDAVAARALVERSRQVDVAIGAGDFSKVHRGLHEIIQVLRAIECPTVLVPGNNENIDELREACRGWKDAHILHGSGVTLHGMAFYGVGGGIPVTPFGDWSYDFSEIAAVELLADCPPGAVLITHSPPLGAVDSSSEGQGLGSTAIRATIEATKPVLAVCGHVHVDGGKHECIANTPVVNAGPGGVEWTLPAGKSS